ncbi:hypothetical protein [Haloferax sp. Atlit-12N]|uniref:hypothetical protein n=1 Tax=Haloferax sp. Atlit-12N TaxID=2077203 RepID=UPI0011E58F47|nr:hypothetical protein [Haloferax sp. Atlit-12N]
MSSSSLSLRFERWQYQVTMYVSVCVIVLCYTGYQSGIAPTVTGTFAIVGFVVTLVSSSGAATYAFDDLVNVGIEEGDD